jgi:hypothetical protein
MVDGFIQQAELRQRIEAIAAIEKGLTLARIPIDNRRVQSIRLDVLGQLFQLRLRQQGDKSAAGWILRTSRQDICRLLAVGAVLVRGAGFC